MRESSWQRGLVVLVLTGCQTVMYEDFGPGCGGPAKGTYGSGVHIDCSDDQGEHDAACEGRADVWGSSSPGAIAPNVPVRFATTGATLNVPTTDYLTVSGSEITAKRVAPFYVFAKTSPSSASISGIARVDVGEPTRIELTPYYKNKYAYRATAYGYPRDYGIDAEGRPVTWLSSTSTPLGGRISFSFTVEDPSIVRIKSTTEREVTFEPLREGSTRIHARLGNLPEATAVVYTPVESSAEDASADVDAEGGSDASLP